MALFGKKKTEKKEDKKAVMKPVSAKATAGKSKNISTAASHIIVRPHITEKSGMLAQTGVYTFEVVKGANSQQVAEAVEVMYKVVPERVSVLPIRAKKTSYRGIPGFTPKSMKAYVYLKKGDTIEFI